MSEAPFLDYFAVRNVACIRDAVIRPSRLHALIGPNDSGKSTLLRTIESTFGWAAGQGYRTDLLTAPAAVVAGVGEIRFIPKVGTPGNVEFSFRDQRIHGATNIAGLRGTPIFRITQALGSLPAGSYASSHQPNSVAAPDATQAIASFVEWFAPTAVVRFDPDAMRQITTLLKPGSSITFQGERGEGLAALLDGIRDHRDTDYEAIRDEVLDLFPTVARLQLERTSTQSKVIQIELQDGTRVPAHAMSEGVLYALGFLALERAAPASVFLVEEPENGLHPARIADIVRVLRRISQRTQVILATHSPLVINELEGHEVSVVTRSVEKGTKITLLKDTFNYEERARVYKNGELWLNFCDGKGEKELLSGPEAA